jgi:hypothetical protein
MRAPTTGEINFNVVFSSLRKIPELVEFHLKTSYRCIKFCNFRQFLRSIGKTVFFTIRFITSVCPSVRMEQLASHWVDFHEILY